MSPATRPKRLFRFRNGYFLLTGALLLTEAGIALYVHDAVVRPYGGDLLATVFVYCLGRSFLAMRVGRTLAVALLISYLVEGLQYLDVLGQLGWQHIRVVRIVFGSHFAWGDVLAYSLGALAVLAIERCRQRRGTRHLRPQSNS